MVYKDLAPRSIEADFDAFDVLLGQAVESQLDFDVNGCMFLSGGVSLINYGLQLESTLGLPADQGLWLNMSSSRI